jgi:succinate dehydrogenase hydrophobic membrane anchor protein
MTLNETHKPHGAIHWWIQQVISAALIPLTLWYVYVISIHIIPGVDNTQMLSSFLQELVQNKFMLLAPLVILTMLHSYLGLNESIEDYIHNSITKVICLVSIQIIVLKTSKFLLLYLMH